MDVLRKFWIFETDVDRVRLSKFKKVNKMMQNYFENKMLGVNELDEDIINMKA